jgi:NADPH-dependent ferric siderophore reductase
MNFVKQKTIGFFEGRLVKSATVLAVRAWDPATFIEIDLHMPGVDMNKWQEAQHIKCKVGALTYRDYTPSQWDADTRTCTLFVDVAHDGPGSRWARAAVAGDVLHYLGISSSHHRPVADKRMVLLGDESAIGHFLALGQLAEGFLADDLLPGGGASHLQVGGAAGNGQVPAGHSVGGRASVCGAIAIAEKTHRAEFARYFPWSGLDAVNKERGTDSSGLEAWVGQYIKTGKYQDASGRLPDTVFYLAGNVPAMVRLRKILRQKGCANGQVRVQGFWD